VGWRDLVSISTEYVKLIPVPSEEMRAESEMFEIKLAFLTYMS
jgi:hypothetical protein